jgi:hypothetical protein
MQQRRNPQLLEVVEALRPSRRRPGGLHGGQEQGDQHANDGNDDKQFDQGKT